MPLKPIFQQVEWDEFEGTVSCKKDHVRDEAFFTEIIGKVLNMCGAELLVTDTIKRKDGSYSMNVAAFK